MLTIDYIVNAVFDSITWLLFEVEGNRVWLVDCGDWERITEKVEDRRIEGVLLTHAHFDHIYGLPRLTERFPEVIVFTNEEGREALANEQMNMSKYQGDPVRYRGSNVVLCGEGAEISLFEGVSARVYETPGHNPSSICYKVGDYLFTGDAYIPGAKVVTTLPGGDKAQAARSLERILMLAKGKKVCAGHKV